MSFLPGWRPAGRASKFVRVRYVTHVVYQNSTGTYPLPADIHAGDFIFCWDLARNFSGVPTAVIPTGFTVITNQPISTTTRTITSWKLATGTEGGTNIQGMVAVTLGSNAIIVIFRGETKRITSVAGVLDVDFEQEGGEVGPHTITSASAVPNAMAMCVYFASSDPATGGDMIPEGDVTIVGVSDTMMFKARYFDLGTTPTNTVVDLGNPDFSAMLNDWYVNFT